MNKISVDVVKNVAVKGYMKLRKISPELALAGGIACGIGAVVVGIISSKKLEAIVENTKDELDVIQKTHDASDDEQVKEIKKLSWKAYNKMVWRIARELAPAIGLEVASIALILLSHGILNKRYLNTTAAYTALQEAFMGYRGRVKEAIGDEAEEVLMAGGKIKKNIDVEDEDGNVTKVAGNHIVIDEHKNSPYEFDFNRHTAPMTWSSNPDYSEAYLRNIQNYFNDLLRTRGHVFLNEVLDQIGLKRTPAGAICGWIRGAGDDYIDFGYMDSFMRDYKIDSDLCRKNIHLNFNVDGPIWNAI